jgi:hypothetical protein
MVRVPTYDGPTRQPGSSGFFSAPTPTPYRPQDATREVRAGLAGLTQGVESLERRQEREVYMRQERYDEAVVRSRVAEYRLGGETLLQDPERGYLQSRGEAAIGPRRRDINVELAQRRQKIADELQDPIQRELFDRSADQFDSAFHRSADQHAGQERERFGISAAQANADSLLLGAPQLYATDRAAFDGRLDSIDEALAVSGQLKGQAPKEIAMEQARARSSVWATVVDSVSRGPEGPVRAFEMVGELEKSGALLPGAARTLSQQLDAAAEQHTAQNTAVEVWGDTKDLGQARDRLLKMREDKALTPKQFDSAMHFVRQAHADDTNAEQSASARELEEAKRWAYDADASSPHDLEVASPGSVERLKRAGMWDSFTSWWDSGKRHTTKSGVIEELGRLRADGTLAKMPFEEFYSTYRRRLSDRDMAHYSTYTADVGERSKSRDSVAGALVPDGVKLGDLRKKIVRQMRHDQMLASTDGMDPKGFDEVKAYDYEQTFMPMYQAALAEGTEPNKAWMETSDKMRKDLAPSGSEYGIYRWQMPLEKRDSGAMSDDGVDVIVSPGTYTQAEAGNALERLRKPTADGAPLRDPALFTITDIMQEVAKDRVRRRTDAAKRRKDTPGWVSWTAIERSLGVTKDEMINRFMLGVDKQGKTIASHVPGELVHSSDFAYRAADFSGDASYVAVRFPGDKKVNTIGQDENASGSLGISLAAFRELSKDHDARAHVEGSSLRAVPTFAAAVKASETVLQMPLDPKSWQFDGKLAARIDDLSEEERTLTSTHGEAYPRVRQLRAQIAVLHTRLLPVQEADYRAAMDHLEIAEVGFQVEYPGIERRDYKPETADARNARKTWERLQAQRLIVEQATQRQSWKQLEQYRRATPTYLPSATEPTEPAPSPADQRLKERMDRIRKRDAEFQAAERQGGG